MKLRHLLVAGLIAGLSGSALAQTSSIKIYMVDSNGDLRWYDHTGAGTGASSWAAPNVVGNGWGGVRVLGSTNGSIWLINTSGGMQWYRHAGLATGANQWAPLSGTVIGSAFPSARYIAGPNGVIYMIEADGDLIQWRHEAYANGGGAWANSGVPQTVGNGWGDFAHVVAGSNGSVYGITTTGSVRWYQHTGRMNATYSWAAGSGTVVATGWPSYAQVFAGPNGVLYTISNDGTLTWRRHTGFADGSTGWEGPHVVGSGWPTSRPVFAAFPEEWYQVTPIEETPVEIPEYTSATYHGQWPCREGFLDVGRAECWSCPSGYNRTVYSVTTNQACEYTNPAVNSYASYHGSPWAACGYVLGFWVCAPVATECGSGRFLDAYNGGGCYSCPSGYNRTASHIANSDACNRPSSVSQSSATYHAPSGCRAGEFHDPRNGGECWSCPAMYDRSITPVTSGDACDLRDGQDFCNATFDLIGNLIPDDLSGGALAGQCAVSFVRGAACLLPEMAGEFVNGGMTVNMPGCSSAPPVINYICEITTGEVPRFTSFVQCVNNILNVAENAGNIVFEPANLDTAACEALGETAAGAVIESRLRLPSNRRTQRIHDLFDRLENSQAVRAANGATGAIEQVRSLVEACVTSL